MSVVFFSYLLLRLSLCGDRHERERTYREEVESGNLERDWWRKTRRDGEEMTVDCCLNNTIATVISCTVWHVAQLHLTIFSNIFFFLILLFLSSSGASWESWQELVIESLTATPLSVTVAIFLPLIWVDRLEVGIYGGPRSN